MRSSSFGCGNKGALIIRIGFWGILYYNIHKEPLKPYSNHQGPYTGALHFRFGVQKQERTSRLYTVLLCLAQELVGFQQGFDKGCLEGCYGGF